MSNELAIESIIKKQLLQVQQLEQILMLEKEILQQHNPDELLKISHQKTDLLVAIDATEKESKTIPDYKTLITSVQFEPLLNDIETALANCKNLNTVNGMIIQQSSMAIERMQNDLVETRSKSSMTYDNKGKKSGGLQGKSIKA